jgi:small-conductance mechanosensitive channel
VFVFIYFLFFHIQFRSSKFLLLIWGGACHFFLSPPYTHTHLQYTNTFFSYFRDEKKFFFVRNLLLSPVSPLPPPMLYTTLSLFFLLFFSMAIRRCVVHVLADIFINNNGFFDLCMSFSLLTFVFARLFLTFYCQILVQPYSFT